MSILSILERPSESRLPIDAAWPVAHVEHLLLFARPNGPFFVLPCGCYWTLTDDVPDLDLPCDPHLHLALTARFGARVEMPEAWDQAHRDHARWVDARIAATVASWRGTKA